MDQTKLKWRFRKRAFAIILIVLMTATFAFYNAYVGSRGQFVIITDAENVSNFLVWNENCKIPRIEILNDETRPLFHNVPYKSCSNKEPLTYVLKENNTATLYVDSRLVSSYDEEGVKCCLKYVHRDSKSDSPDFKTKYSQCYNFATKIQLESEFSIVKCDGIGSKTQVYENAHAVVYVKAEADAQYDKYRKLRPSHESEHRHISVLMIGIDSLSRMQQHRSLPKTSQILDANGWIELEGYNKVGDNTFPNLCAVLLGMDYVSVYEKCNPDVLGELDKCGFIWKKFHDQGYVTAYAEDSGSINTFNYNRKGFKDPPTDYYLRPYVVAAEEQLRVVIEYGIGYCVGPVQSSERILEYAKDFSATFKDRPNFGLFWMSSFTHNEFSEPTMMDDKLVDFINYLHREDITKNSIVVFFSDHGIRFGDIMKTRSGWYEERLPMFNVWLPDWYRKKFKKQHRNLLSNKNKLMTPYDLHMTLQDVLSRAMSPKKVPVARSEGCVDCKSLFAKHRKDRSCREAGVNLHYCTCFEYRKVNYIDNWMQPVGPFLVQVINDMFTHLNETKHCSTLSLDYIREIKMSQSSVDRDGRIVWYLLVMFGTSPGGGLFEASVGVKYLSDGAKPVFEQIGEISRLNAYGSQGDCVTNDKLQKYCYCKRSWFENLFRF